MKKLHLICNSHIDPVWMWDWEEGLGTAISTFYQAAEFCDEYDYIFCHNESILYEFIQEHDPVLFARIQKLVAEGKWHIMGGWYLQPDCNMPSGEAFVRQIKLGREYFQEQFGKRPTVAINFDSFGHSVGLPQILAKCGFMGSIICRPMPNLIDLPGDVFTWVGKDGSKVKVFRSHSDSLYTTSYGNAVRDIKEKASRFGEDEIGAALWGVGNHGGNPSRKDFGDLAEYMKQVDFPVVHSTPEAFMEEVPSKGEYHQSLPCLLGAYTSMNTIKQKHIELENKLFSTEKLCALAKLNGLYTWNKDAFQRAEKALSSIAFHDILSGTCGPDGEKSALRKADCALELLNEEFNKAFFSICSQQLKAGNGEFPIFVYNPMPYKRKTVCEVEFLSTKTISDVDARENIVTVRKDGEIVPSQCVHELTNINYDRRKRIAFLGELEPLSVTRFDITIAQRDKVKFVDGLQDDIVVHDAYKTVRIGRKTGLLESFVVDGKELLAGGGFAPVMFDDVADPWGFDIERLGSKPVPFALSGCNGGCFDSLKSVRIIEQGDVVTTVESLFELGHSTVRVCYKLYKDVPEIDVDLDVIWDEHLKALKVKLPVALSGDFVGQIAFATDSFPENGTEVIAQRFVAIEDGENALALYNNCTYGFSCDGQDLYATLLRGVAYCAHPIGENPLIDDDRYIQGVEEGRHHFGFRLSYDKMAELENRAAEFNQMPYTLNYFPHGTKHWAQAIDSRLTVSEKALSLVAFYAQGEDYILRVLNNQSKPACGTITLGEDSRSFDFGAYEAKTLRYHDGTLTEEAYMC